MSYPGAPPPPGGFPNQPPGIELCDEIACNLLSVEYGSYKNSLFKFLVVWMLIFALQF